MGLFNYCQSGTSVSLRVSSPYLAISRFLPSTVCPQVSGEHQEALPEDWMTELNSLVSEMHLVLYSHLAWKNIFINQRRKVSKRSSRFIWVELKFSYSLEMRLRTYKYLRSEFTVTSSILKFKLKWNLKLKLIWKLNLGKIFHSLNAEWWWMGSNDIKWKANCKAVGKFKWYVLALFVKI